MEQFESHRARQAREQREAEERKQARYAAFDSLIDVALAGTVTLDAAVDTFLQLEVGE